MSTDESSPEVLIPTLFQEILRDTHRYTPGRDARRPTLARRPTTKWRSALGGAREYGRDALERLAAHAGFSHGHFNPDLAAERLIRLNELSAGLEETYAQLADDASRRTMMDLLKLRVLGPHHARLAVTPQEFRSKQTYAERNLRTAAGTYEVSDPWFSPLSLYRIPLANGSSVEMHGHSVDLVSVFMLTQYLYDGGNREVVVEPGDVVLDVGGCWGDTALYFAHLVGVAGRVYTFEFDPENLAVLRTNLELNSELGARVEIVQKAVWERSGETLHFHAAGRCTRLTDGGPSEDTQRVPTVTLDEFVAQAGLERLDFVKMDVEGAELQILNGGIETLKRLRPKLAIAAYHRDDDLVRIPQALQSLDVGYRLYLKSSSPVEEETVLFATTEAV